MRVDMTVNEFVKSMERYDFYVDKPDVLTGIAWEPVAKSTIAFDRKLHHEAGFVLPAKVTYNKYFVGPLGAYSPHYGSLEKSKYRMTCAAPENEILSDIFHRGIEVFNILQDSIARTSNQQFLLETVEDEDRLVVSLPVFEKRRSPIMPHTYLEDLVQNKKGTEHDFFSDDNPAESMSELDKATKNYPVPSEYTDRFDAIKSSYSVNELPVYYNDKFVPPHMTSRVLENAVIELHIGVTHNYMRKDAKKFDSFNGNIREVNIYIPGSSRPLSPYKRKNP